MAISQMLMATTREPPSSVNQPAQGSFTDNGGSSIAATWSTNSGGQSPTHTATGYSYGGSPIGYGTQGNNTPFSTSQDWNNNISKVYSNTAYSGRTHAASMAALCPRNTGSWLYSNSWETAWWLDGGGNSSSDILVVIFSSQLSFSGIRIENSQSTYGGNETVHVSYLVGSPGAMQHGYIGNTTWNGGSTPATISWSGTSQAFAVWRTNSTSWGRIENIRFMK